MMKKRKEDLIDFLQELHRLTDALYDGDKEYTMAGWYQFIGTLIVLSIARIEWMLKRGPDNRITHPFESVRTSQVFQLFTQFCQTRFTKIIVGDYV